MNSAGNKNRIKKRLVSLVTAAALMTNAMPLNGLTELAGLFRFRSPAVISAEAEFTPSKAKTAFSGNDISFNTMSDLVDYSYYINTDSQFAADHAGDTIRITLAPGETSVLSGDFMGIGTREHPFKGIFLFGTTTSGSITLERALFGGITDSAQIRGSDNNPFTLVLTRSANVADDASAPLLADYIKHENGTPPAIKWHIQAEGSSTYSGLIGEMGENAVVDMIFENNNTANLVSNAAAGTNTGADIGYLCGRMGDNASLTVDYRSAAMNKTVTSKNGNAGGLVGTMASGAALTLKGSLTTYTPAVVSNAEDGYAGGLVGELYSDSTLTMTAGLGSTVAIGGSSRADEGGAGGLFGHYINKEATESIDVSTYYRSSSKKLTATASGKYGGGLFGVFENDATAQTSYTVTFTGTSDDAHTSGVKNDAGHFGGLIGRYKAKSLTDTLNISDLNISTTAANSFLHFGGVIGLVDSPAYIKVTGTTVAATGANKNTSSAGFFGGLVGSAGSVGNGVFIDLRGFTLTSANDFYGGGVVGEFNSGVLRLSGTTNMSAAKPAGTATSALTNGQLIGLNDNVLTYAVSGWDYKRSGGAYADDLGTWGEVVRISGIEPGIVNFNSTAHTVTVAAAVPAMSSQSDLVKTALSMQLESCGCLIMTSNKATMLGTDLSLGGDISFEGTGITGLMRDGGTSDTIGKYTGTFDGKDHNITLTVGEPYSYDTTAETTPEGVGQIYRHQYNGLFSILAGKVMNLTIKNDSYFNIRNCVDGMNIGGIAACNGGNVTLTKITANETINYYEGASISGTETAGKNIGGLIGLVGTDGNIKINGVSEISTTINLSGKKNAWNCYGGAIGKITASTFTVDIGTTNDKLTNKLAVNSTLSSNGTNGDCGGLIGYITKAGSYSGRTINLNNVEFDGCTIVNPASTNGGGFLGYAWLNTTTNVNGVTVKSGTISNSTPGNIGVMLYSSTGKMDVNSLTITNMTMTAGGTSSLGMIVNKAYDGDDGLYLTVKNSGYTLNAAPSVSSTVFDEIAAYSASSTNSLIQGGNGVGVVNIDMNTGTNTTVNVADRTVSEATVTGTGTYINKTSKNYTNPNTRYYYNLNHAVNTDDGQNLLLWSVYKYAASNIEDEFKSGAGTNTSFGTTLTTLLSGTADMTGLSFYPVYKADGCTIGNLTLTLDYSSIYAKDSNRDPAASNQHYLMHSGLFLNSSAGSALTISGALSLNGNFLEVGKYSGVLISDTMNGSLTCTSGSVVLNGITAKTTANADYASGYLLINNITRASVDKAVPELKLYNVSQGTYTSGTHFKSLIGAAKGSGLKMEFSKIKLDGAISSSIFSESTLVNSIRTDNEANDKLTYNYTYDDDWTPKTNGGAAPRNVTYGYEITHSVEYSGKEEKYSSGTGTEKHRWFTNPNNNTQLDEAADFDNYLPYVKEKYTNSTAGSDGFYYRELKVNVEASGLTVGCGTYNDPYIITTAEQLKGVAAFIKAQSEGTVSPKDTLGNVNLPKTVPPLFTSGERWCNNKSSHGEYTATATGFTKPTDGADWSNDQVCSWLCNAYYKINTDITLDSQFVGLGGITAKTAWRGVIVGNGTNAGPPAVTITNKSEKPFINVSNGCVIKDINIKVEKSDGITLTQTNNAYNNAYFGYDYTSSSVCKFYGGIIGEIMGGDNIIDNSYVSYKYTETVKGDDGNPVIENGVEKTVDKNTTITLSGGNGTIVPAGGYVGVVVFGAVIFKNMDASKTTVANTGLNVVYSNGNTATTEGINLASETKTETDPDTEETTIVKNQEAWAAIYVNPIVGRVINGYAVNETGGNALDAEGNAVQQYSVTENGKYHDDDKIARAGTQHTLKNGTKHYSIADLDPYYGKTAAQWNDLTDAEKNALMLDVTPPESTSADGTIDVPNAQALFVLSLITQSTAGTAPELFGTGSGTHTDETVETSRTDDGNGNITVYKTRTITDIDDSLCDYANSLSYGTYGTGSSTAVYGMSHTAIYSDVGTSESTSSDYTTYVGYDTAANDALPYIISHYTVGGLKTSSTTTVGEPEVVPASTEGKTEIFDGSLDDLDGKEIYIYNDGYYMHPNIIDSTNNKGLDASTTLPSYKLLVTKQSNGKYTLTYNNGSTQYISLPSNRGLTFTSTFSSTNCEFTINKLSNGKFEIYNDNLTITQKYIGLRNKTHFYGQPVNSSNASNSSVDGTEFDLYVYTPPSSTTTTTITTTITNTNTVTYPARCVTSTLGYYDIYLTGSGIYQLPDSFRGLGCVGNNNDQFALKVDTFDGKGSTIDEDIYLNKYQTDNYFNKIHSGTTQSYSGDTILYTVNKDSGEHHGIGLFDSIVTSGADSILTHFTISGSVNTEIYKNGYNATTQELTVYGDDDARFLSVGGVCGSSNGNMVYLKFDQIILNQLSVCGSCAVGGILGYSNNQNYLDNKYNNIPLTINKCSAADLSLKMNSSLNLNSNNNQQPRNAIGGYVGKCVEGMVIITGDTTSGSNVTIKSFGYETLTGVTDHRTVAGGLVGFAGNGCTIKDMNVSPSTGYTVEIGSDYTGYAGGLVGLMQPAKDGGSSCVAVFQNCNVEKINVNGHYAGGFYGGKWINTYSPYSILLDNCQMLGDATNNNTIKGNSLRNAEGYAGGFLGCGNVYTDGDPNIEIKDCMVSHYTITSTAYNDGKKGYAGGFIGYTGAQATGRSITCYIHDSSVENCTIGTSGNHAGGAIGRVVRQNSDSKNKILGYNIKLDTVTLSGTKNGAWIGWVNTNDDTTSIQFTGVGIYGNGFAQNVGNRANFSNASFVFADYTDANANMTDQNKNASNFNASADTNVDMPKYPYVNVNPQSKLGGNEVISGDGAVLYSSDVEDFTGTGKNTMAAKIYSEWLVREGRTDKQYYTTFEDIAIKDGYTIDDYMNRTTATEGDRISTFATERGQALQNGVQDFAVVVIANRDDAETTALINRYIQLVTNTSKDKNYAETNEYYNIDIRACEYDPTDGSFEIQDPEVVKPGLQRDTENGLFKLDNDNTDYKEGGKRFTLLDVQFLDPLGKSKIAYHLYVPVYTIREMEVDFYASARPGTNSVAYYTEEGTDKTDNEYADQWKDNSEIKYYDNLDSWFTHYIRYEYDEEDLTGLLNSGKLRWTYKKSFKIDTTVIVSDDNALPDGTYLVLVDPNANGDRAFYAKPGENSFTSYDVTSTDNTLTRSAWTVDLEKFKDSSNVGYTPKTFNDMLAEVIAVDNSVERRGKSRYDLGTSSDYDVYVINDAGEEEYYKLNSNNTGDYELSLPRGYKLCEDYYISVYVPKPNDYKNQMYRYGIVAPDRFDSGENSIFYEGTKPQIKTANITQKNQCNVTLADLFQQLEAGQKMTVGPDVFQITASNRTITVDLKTTITPASDTGMNYIEDVFHSFKLSLDRYHEGGDFDSKIIGLTKEDIEAYYSINQEIDDEHPGKKCRDIDLQKNYLNIATTDEVDSEKIVTDLRSVNAEKKVEIYARVVMTFDEDELEDEFPTKESSGNIGVNVSATSNLAFYPESLAFSSSSVPFARNSNYYYIESIATAKLKYNPPDYDPDIYDPIGNSSKNQTKTGVNANYAENSAMLVNTVASYSVLSLPDAKDAETLRLTFSLSKKTDNKTEGAVTGVEYTQINKMEEYLNGYIVFTSGEATAQVAASGESGEVNLPFQKCETDGDYYKINIAFYVKTGDGFAEYANYRADLKAELFKTVVIPAPEQGEEPTPEEGEGGEGEGGEGEGSEGEGGGAAAATTRIETIENSVARDYLIYTNAKVCAEFIKHSGS